MYETSKAAMSSTFISREDDIVMISLSSKAGLLVFLVLAAVFNLAATQFGYEREFGLGYGGFGRGFGSYGRGFGGYGPGLGGYGRFGHGVYG
ncbi:neuropeptide-like protein 30 [Dermacentor silvarum]|uniref:neuropeptide-like protein 30 n=1 Tax=Dermacentor silvarum TaxID=543639 RepID=UPI001897468E|nr:neuropeptide-like protein 30 [Dermacentor silvarum]